MAFTSCILFTSVTSEQNTTSKGYLALKKATISREYDVHRFEGQTSLTNFLMNVEHKCLKFSIRIRVYHSWPFLSSLIIRVRPIAAFHNLQFRLWKVRIAACAFHAFEFTALLLLALPRVTFQTLSCFSNLRFIISILLSIYRPLGSATLHFLSALEPFRLFQRWASGQCPVCKE